MANARYDNKAAGKRFVWLLLVMLIGLVFVYVGSHLAVKPSEINPKKSDIVTVATNGVITVNDYQKLLFFSGSDRVELFTKEMASNNLRIRNLQTGLEMAILQLVSMERFGTHTNYQAELKICLTYVEEGNFSSARTSWIDYLNYFVKPTKAESRLQLEKISASFEELKQIKSSQNAAVNLLDPPSLASTQWLVGSWLIAEILFWSIFGVLTQLLVKSSEFLIKGSFMPREKIIAFTKLAYGPILSIVIIEAMTVGWIGSGDYEIVSWTLPILAFVLGFNSRKTVTLFDRLSARIFGKLEKGVDEGPSVAREAYKQRLLAIMEANKPKTFDEVIENGIKVAKVMISNTVQNKEAKL